VVERNKWLEKEKKEKNVKKEKKRKRKEKEKENEKKMCLNKIKVVTNEQSVG
jgi:hypothetical protein